MKVLKALSFGVFYWSARLREMREQSDKDHQEELDLYVKTNQDLKTQMEAMHIELTAKQVRHHFDLEFNR